MSDLSPRDENPCRPRHFKPDPCGPAAPPEGPARRTLDTSHARLLVTAGLFCLAFAVIGLRLVQVTVLDGDPRVARHEPAETVSHARADIVDRNGVLLATTLETPSLFADPKQVIDPKDAAQKLASVLPDINAAELEQRLASGKSFVWVRRHLTPREEALVNNLGLPGFQFMPEGRRVYPEGNLFAHVVGYSDTDGNGLAGVERGLNSRLKRGGKPVVLSLDERLQFILHDETAKAISDFHAIGGMGIILDVRTGETLAMVSLPDFDPNDPGTATPETTFNRATLGDYEMGSVFKIFTIAMALDDHVSTLESSYDATNPIHIGRFTIHDDHAQRRWLTVPEIFQYSSNIGAAKIGLEVGPERQEEFLAKLGLTREPRFELKEIATPLVPSPWRPINTMTIAFGHGMSVSPLQLVTGVAAVVNGGVLHPTTLLKRADGEPESGVRVLSNETSVDMRKLLRLVVERGTGKLAEAPGYLVGGKTGTAEKVAGKHYETHALLSSFVGVFPVNDPRYLVFVSIDEPHGNKQSFGYATGGWVAAPAVRNTIERMASIVGIQPVDENSPEISRSLMVDLPTPPGRTLAAN
ncbi:MAG TPA: penicillin-binding protein 2 [Stellaceae bacterium]|nr:penicillin-binding protein 2 [Stellaceae bacterium]